MNNTSNEFDLIVIGGGINGAGIARDAAERGLKVLLLEKNDFGSGTSSWSSRLIHGGLRYLEYGEVPLVFESLRERRVLQRIAPHLVRRLPLTVPVYEHSKRGMWLIRMGMIAYDLLSIGKSVPRHRMLSRQKLMEAMPGLNQVGLRGGARYFDAQVTYAERLVLENIVAAERAGAVCLNYSPVIGINVSQNQFKSLQYIDRDTGNEVEASATLAINAAGPWVDRVLGTVNREMPDFMGGTKGSHIVVPRFAKAPKDALYAEARADGRPFFIIPWNEQFLIGTTDIRYNGEPSDVHASEEEIDYLLTETNRLFPEAHLRRDHVHYTYSGVRPLPRAEAGPESAITRRHIIKKHRVLARGLVSIIGGKLTTYRNLAEQATDYACKKNDRRELKCQTASRPLPGAAGIEEARTRLADVPALSREGRRRMLAVYGGFAKDIVDLALTSDELAGTIDVQRTMLVAEVHHAIKAESAVTLIDVIHRRMMIGLDADQGRPVAAAVAELAGQLLGWDKAELGRQIARLQQYNDRLAANAG